jgi:hypothetical protein
LHLLGVDLQPYHPVRQALTAEGYDSLVGLFMLTPTCITEFLRYPSNDDRAVKLPLPFEYQLSLLVPLGYRMYFQKLYQRSMTYKDWLVTTVEEIQNYCLTTEWYLYLKESPFGSFPDPQLLFWTPPTVSTSCPAMVTHSVDVALPIGEDIDSTVDCQIHMSEITGDEDFPVAPMPCDWPIACGEPLLTSDKNNPPAGDPMSCDVDDDDGAMTGDDDGEPMPPVPDVPHLGDGPSLGTTVSDADDWTLLTLDGESQPTGVFLIVDPTSTTKDGDIFFYPPAGVIVSPPPPAEPPPAEPPPLWNLTTLVHPSSSNILCSCMKDEGEPL